MVLRTVGDSFFLAVPGDQGAALALCQACGQWWDKGGSSQTRSVHLSADWTRACPGAVDTSPEPDLGSSDAHTPSIRWHVNLERAIWMTGACPGDTVLGRDSG